jgi:hypothetical protein
MLGILLTSPSKGVALALEGCIVGQWNLTQTSLIRTVWIVK